MSLSIFFGKLSQTAKTALCSAPTLLPLAIVWIAATVTIVLVHFYRAWKKFGQVPSRRAYPAWVGFETLAMVSLIVLGIHTAWQ